MRCNRAARAQQPVSALLTALISSPIDTVPSWLVSHAAHMVTSAEPRAMLTAAISSFTATTPLPSQSPEQPDAGVAVGVGDGGTSPTAIVSIVIAASSPSEVAEA